MKVAKSVFGSILFLVATFCLLASFGFRIAGTAKESVEISGAWQLVKTSNPARTAPNVIKIVVDGAFTFADYDLNQQKFLGAGGGTFIIDKNTYTEKISYFTQDSTRLGTTIKYTYTLQGNTLKLTGMQNGKSLEENWKRIDDAKTTMADSWRIRERETEPGKMRVMPRGARKTIKWLSGTRFQWAAINTETGQFFGAGGGTYTVQNGKNTERIEFFSRDSKRVGMQVSFDHELKNDH